MPILKMQELDLADRRVLVRQDLNVPIANGAVSNDARIRASLPTILLGIEQNAKMMLMSHLGRPTEGVVQSEFSLLPVARRIEELLQEQGLSTKVRLVSQWLDGVEIDEGEIVLCENVRFNEGEKANDEVLSKRMAKICDVFVMDAFGTAHRAQASTYGVAEFAPVSCAGPLLSNELDALGKALNEPARPIVAIVGGSKVSTKLTVLDSLSDKVDQLIVGGGIANTFIASTNRQVGKSLYEEDLIPQAQTLSKKAEAGNGLIPIPTDVVCGKEFSAKSEATTKAIDEVSEDDMIFDIGPDSSKLFAEYLKGAGTIVWNGPVGVFEFDQFANGTKAIALAVANSSAFSIAGGGDTVAAIEKFNVADDISYISTGGGAFLEFLEGKALPAVSMLEQRYPDNG